jgi:hypothetical protein
MLSTIVTGPVYCTVGTAAYFFHNREVLHELVESKYYLLQ